jgi:hypothetical protein
MTWLSGSRLDCASRCCGSPTSPRTTSINLLQQVYLATHPGAQDKFASAPVAEGNAEAEAELLANLAAEAEEEDRD